MIKLSIITVFPEIHEPFLSSSLLGKAVDKGILTYQVIRLSSLVAPKERIDEPTAGPGAGMIIKPHLITDAIIKAEQQYGPGTKIFFSPQGKTLSQPMLRSLCDELCMNESLSDDGITQTKAPRDTHLILICSRYEGIDARVEEYYADLVVSIGDYVLMGGDIPAQVFLEGLLRLVPGVVGNQESVREDSFSGALLDYPQYGLPVEWEGKTIPEVILSGNHAKISAWRKQAACQNTVKKRFDWFIKHNPTEEEKACARQTMPRHYVVVMHTQIVLKGGAVGESSIASLDIHDIARSCATYGIAQFFIASPLKDQRTILDTFLNFWRSSEGKKYNQSRYVSMKLVEPVSSLDEVIAQISLKEGKQPLLIATSAKQHKNAPVIDYHSHERVWEHDRPVLFIFGTGQGLADVVLDRCDYILAPLYGLSDYNHLSVRAAASIILDRWLGLDKRINPKRIVKKALPKIVD